MIKVEKLNPFGRMCVSLGMLPSSYKESLTYEEQLLWFMNYLENNVIPAVNNNADAVEELQNYVEHYFDNLDVQEEINHKLDEMAEDGTIGSLITTYIDPLFNNYVSETTEELNEFKSEVEESIGEFNTKISSIYNQSPIPVSSTSDMTDNTKIYLLTTNGKWYYYDGSDFVVGGDYVADIDNLVKINGIGEVTARNLESSNKDTYQISGNLTSTSRFSLYEEGKYVYKESNGQISTGTAQPINSYIYKVEELPNKIIIKNGIGRFVVFVQDDKTTVIGDQLQNVYSFSIPDTAKYLYVSINVETYPDFVICDNEYNYIAGNKIKIKEENIIPDLTSGKELTNNLFNKSTLVYSDKYIGTNTSTGIINYTDSELFNTYKIKVKKGEIISFSQIRGACLVDYDNTSWITELQLYPSSLTVTNDCYLYYFIEKAKINICSIKITRGYKKIENFDKFRYSKMNNRNAQVDVLSNVCDNLIITSKIKFSNFANTTLSFVTSDNNATNYIVVSENSISINNSYDSPIVLTHGLTIANDISIKVKLNKGKIDLTLISNGEMYNNEIDFVMLGSRPLKINLNFNSDDYTEGTLNVIYQNIKKDLWIIGDSYCGLANPARWCYYLAQNKENENLLLSASAGSNTVDAYNTLQNLLKIYVPKKVVICTGMNDGTDDETINSTYKTYIDLIIALLNSYNVEIILSTIPSVPSINNELKNAYVKSLNYRYVDFAGAVGAQSDGTWYTGMLSSDNIHPTQKGAKALYSQALADIPEIMY